MDVKPFPDGGHYAAMERPHVLVEDLRTFFYHGVSPSRRGID